MTEQPQVPDTRSASSGPRDPAPFVPDEDAPRDPETGDVAIDEPDVGEPGEQAPEVEDVPESLPD